MRISGDEGRKKRMKWKSAGKREDIGENVDRYRQTGRQASR